MYGRPLVYLDNAATTQKPLSVLDAMREEYLNVNANVHRGVHYLSQQATDLHEAARERVRQFVHAEKIEEIIFTRGTTEAINLVASSFCESQMQEGDEVLVTEMEHHSNIVPWQLQAQKRGIVVKHIPITDDGYLELSTLNSQLSTKTKLICIAHVSNVLGTINPVEDIIKTAHERGIPVLVDGAQSAPHMTIDVQALDCDFFAFSGHKMYGPTGIGVLYGKEEWLEKLPPYQGGGEMIDKVTWEKTTFERLPLNLKLAPQIMSLLMVLRKQSIILNPLALKLSSNMNKNSRVTAWNSCKQFLISISMVHSSLLQRMLSSLSTLAISIIWIWVPYLTALVSLYALVITVHNL